MLSQRGAVEASVEALQKEIEQLRLENSVIFTYNEKKTAELGADEEGGKRRRKNKNFPTKLSSDQKYEIANIVHEDLLAEIESNRKSSEKQIDALRAYLEEREIRIGEMKRDTYEFKRDIVAGAENPRTGKIMAERVIRYFDDKNKQMDVVIEKLRLKNANLRSQINKLESTLAQKEEIGDVLHYIDFHQLQIENKQYTSKIEERNDELLSVKHSGSKTTQALNEFKRRLNQQLEDGEWLRGELRNKESLIMKLKDDRTRVNKELVVERKNRNRLRQQIEEAAEMPDIEEYIMLKRTLQQLEGVQRNWQKKVEIMEMAAKRSRSMARSATAPLGRSSDRR